MRGRRIVLGAGLAVLLGGAGHAQGQPWTRLGSREVRLVNDRDRIVVSGAMGTFTAIRLEVRGNGVFFETLDITFGTGERQHVAIRGFIERGGSTRVIQLSGRSRTIRHVDLRYRRVPGGGRATVTLLGRRG